MTDPAATAGLSGTEADARGRSARWAGLTPVGRRVLLIAIAISATEFALMWVLDHVFTVSGTTEYLLDSLLLVTLLAPLLYFLLFRPMAEYLDQREKAQEALHYSEEKYSTLVESSLTGILIFREGKIVFANQSVADILGYSRQELLEIDPTQLVHPDEWAYVTEMGRRRQRGEVVPSEYEFRVLKKSGETIWLNAKNTLIPYRGGVSTLSNVHDITRRKEMEEALKRSRQELQLLSSQLFAAQEVERARLARELHDGIGQSLSAIKFAIEHTVGTPYPDERRHQMGSLQSLVPKIQDTVEEVRRMSMALRPSVLDDLGLVATLAWHCREFQLAHPQIVVDRQVSVEETRIPEKLKIVVYRIAQEAMNNAAKHASPSHVRVGLAKDGGELRLRVEDDGRGFDLERALRADPSWRGFGLGSMRERAELSGGSLSIHSPPGGGTTVEAAWPLPTEEPRLPVQTNS